ncbi:MAG: NAD-dependent epimerase/dehydratase family protein [Synechococcaceae cyanobacterium SM1_2_3]|nr:NAD-dependent epimerase/dehydratase family protein [Synechococcaceae cyanobacterium SM1_2_3]
MALVVAPDFYPDRPVLVTGASGFIGRRIIMALLAQRAKVRALIRASNSAPTDWRDVAIVNADLADAVGLARACAGMNTVIHAAGFAHADAAHTPDFAARHWAINAEGAFRLLDAAVTAGVERFILISSVKAVGEPGPHCVDETWDALAETPYGLAKRAAEQRALTAGHETGLHVVILRPALVYGPGMKGNLARMITAIRRKKFPPLPETGQRRSRGGMWSDVAQAALRAAAVAAAAGQIYLVTDGQPRTSRELYVLIRQSLGLPPPRWFVPASLLYAAAMLADGGRGLMGQRDSRFRAMLDKLLNGACYDSSRIGRELDYQPTWTFQRYCETALQEWRK